MRIRILAVGKIRDKNLEGLVDEYMKRLDRYAVLNIQEVTEEKAPDSLSRAQEVQVRKAECDRLIEHIKKPQYVIALTPDAPQMPSIDFASHLNELGIRGQSDIVCVIGGSLGLDETILERADLTLSLGKMTFPHQLTRVLILEQLYRAFKINRNETYHK
ncbi:MAG: 23S rRNA (pseudouridine(1915)-N(3))-methyltransferase RlmH [Verrucomicrobiota bacterium]|nr:23S rRNA (pseudouridine(1915)-N(3))-methyltransferase RlmH [Verrucomicrobiota bacterium]